MSDRKIVDYKIVCEEVYYFRNKIMEHIRDGFSPIGAPFVLDRDESGNAKYICQAMVKYEDENMKKYLLSRVNCSENEKEPIKVFNSYESFQRGLIDNFKEMVLKVNKEDADFLGDAGETTFCYSFKMKLIECEDEG